MQVTRRSFLSGTERTREIDVTEEQLEKWHNGMLAQNAFPHLSASDREFIMTGIIDEEWDTLKEEDDEGSDRRQVPR
jgi:hypothetical protein